jgi:hypothetical protein
MADGKLKSFAGNPYIIKIFCPDGSPKGLRIIEKSFWSGRGMVIPRSLFPIIRNDPEHKSNFELPGVYVLVGDSDEDGSPLIYIGEGDPVGPRLDQHYLGKDFWKWTIFFEGCLNKAYVQHLEAKLVELATEAKKVSLDNDKIPTYPNLSSAEKAEINGFLSEMLNIFPLVGLDVFEKEEIKRDSPILFLDSNGIHAVGYETRDGFLVQKGSTAVLHSSTGIPRSLRMLRRKLSKERVMVANQDYFKFDCDYEFETPARAAGVIVGHSAGKSYWKDADGKSLVRLQEERVGSLADQSQCPRIDTI